MELKRERMFAGSLLNAMRGALSTASGQGSASVQPPSEPFSLVAYSRSWTVPLVHHRIKKNCHSDLRLYTRRGGAAAFCDGCFILNQSQAC